MNTQNKKTPITKQRCIDALKNFDEIELGYSVDEVVNEANRCLNCKDKPCVKNCPIHNDIPNINMLVASMHFEEAYKLLKKTNCMPSICGRICQQENQCEGVCIRGLNKQNDPVAIGRIERFVADYCYKNENLEEPKLNKRKEKVAVIGSGPAGLAFAYHLAILGYNITIFEKEKEIGGLLYYGIPSFCLPRSKIDFLVNNLEKLGVSFVLNCQIGKEKTLESLLNNDGYSSIFIANGANAPRKMGINGEDGIGVLDACDYLKAFNTSSKDKDGIDNFKYKAKNVIIVGGGNVAIDVDRVAIRLGAKSVVNVYRRSEKEMPARKEEFQLAKEEGIDFRFLTNPKEIILDKDKKVIGIKCIKMELGKPDESGRCSPIEILNSEFIIDCDLVIMALGSVSENHEINSDNKINLDKRGYYIVDKETYKTNLDKVYAGGDAVLGPSTVVEAVRTGQLAAIAVDKELNK